MKMKITMKDNHRPNVGKDINIQNIACLGKIMSIYNKQHLRNI